LAVGGPLGGHRRWGVMPLLIVCTSPELLLVMVMILVLHDPMNGARGGLKSWS
jgi:hypothetical protein